MSAGVIFLSLSTLAEPLPLTLDDALGQAKEKNESYLIAQQEIKKARAQIREARSGALPTLTLSSTYTRNWQLPAAVFDIKGERQRIRLGADNSYLANLTLQQPLYVGGKVGAALKIARYYEAVVKARAREVEAALELEVKRAFYDAVLAQDLVTVAQEALRQAESNRDVVAKLFKEGMVAEFELLRAEVQVANLKPQLLKARNGADLALHNLKTVIGAPLAQEIALVFQFPQARVARVYDYDSLLAQALALRPEVKQLEDQVKIQSQLIGIAQGGYRPSLFASTSYQFQAQSNRFVPDGRDWIHSWNSALLIQIPIFDGFKTPAEVQQAKIDYRESQFRKKQLEDQVALEVRQALGNLNEGRERILAQEKAVDLGRTGLSIAEVRYQNGVGTQLELIDSQVALTTAQTNQVQAFHDFLVAEAQLARAAGTELVHGEE